MVYRIFVFQGIKSDATLSVSFLYFLLYIYDIIKTLNFNQILKMTVHKDTIDMNTEKVIY